MFEYSSKSVRNQYFFLFCVFRNGVDEDLVCYHGFCYAQHSDGHYHNEFIFSKQFDEPHRDYGQTADCSENL